MDIARALAIIPKVLLLDEPFSNLDKLLSEKLFSFVVNEVKKNRTSVILITHRADEALKYADTLAVIDDGKIIQSGKKWDIYYQPKSSRLAGLLGDFNIIKKEDLVKKVSKKVKSKLFLRPDKLTLSSSKSDADLFLTILNCSFNGKCFEVLGETKNGNSILVYLDKALSTNKNFGFTIENYPT